MARLVVNPDSAEAWEIELRPGTYSLGRGEQNDFQLEHSSVSSSHCQIAVYGSGATVKDLGSTSGTFIDGQLVEEARLRSGQVFCLGDVRLRFETDPSEESAAAPASRLREARPPGSGRARPLMGRRPGFAACACGAFLYPLAKDGAVLLVTGTVFFCIIEAGTWFARYAAAKGLGLGTAISLAFLLFMTAFGVGYLTNYLRRVVTSTAMGEQAAPDWPELTDFSGDILSPLFQLAVTILACLGPAITVGMFVAGNETWGQVAVLAASGLGAIYFPMAFLAVAMFDSLAALNPMLIAPSIANVPGQYLLTVALLGIVLAVQWSGDYFLREIIPIPIVPSVISTLIGLYLLMVEARVLGLLYLLNQERLAWFGRR